MWFSRALALRSLYYPWGKMGTTRSLFQLSWIRLKLARVYKALPMSHAIFPSFKIMFRNLQHLPQHKFGALGGVGRERIAWDQAPHGGKKEKKNWRGRKKKSASEASVEVTWGGERVAPPFFPLAPGNRWSCFARWYFSYLTPFLLRFPPLQSLLPCEERRGESTFYLELFFLSTAPKKQQLRSWAKTSQLLALQLSVGSSLRIFLTVPKPVGVTQQILIRGGSAPRSNPYPFINHFSRKRYPFRIPSIDKWYSFHIPCLELCIPFICCECTE